MKRAFALVYVLAVFAWGCHAERDFDVPGRDYVEMLKDKARKLAETEMAKFNAIEQQYRNAIEYHEDLILGHEMLVKTYRDFKRYKLVDIYRSDSYLKPVTVEIEYEFDYHCSPPRHISRNEAEMRALCEKDTEFTLYRRGKVTRRYPCNAMGEYDDSLLDLPAWERFFDKPPEDENMPPPNALPPLPQKGDVFRQ
jgi:hypothetical protein